MRVSRPGSLASLTLACFAVLSTTTFTAVAAPDCAPLGRMPNFQPISKNAETRDYAGDEFKIKKGDEEEIVAAAGRRCFQTYAFKGSGSLPTEREVQRNYRDQIQKLGATVTRAGGSDTHARLSKDGQDTWLRVISQGEEVAVTVLTVVPHKQTLLPPSGADYRLLGHMPNYVADNPDRKNFDGYEFKTKDGDSERGVTIEGALYHIGYNLKNGAVANSDLEIQANYRTALAALGAEILWATEGDTYARLDDKGKIVWVHVHSQQNAIEVYTIDEKPFEASIKAPEAGTMKAALEKDGRIALNVNFDFAKATLKPDSAAVIAQIVKLLKDNPAWKADIEGHTDNVGKHDYNVKLSQDRAAAVVAAIVAQGITRDRLKSAGYGPDKPVEDNGTPEGRAKNRRVELVKS